jgi:hypothetical protein
VPVTISNDMVVVYFSLLSATMFCSAYDKNINGVPQSTRCSQLLQGLWSFKPDDEGLWGYFH